MNFHRLYLKFKKTRLTVICGVLGAVLLLSGCAKEQSAQIETTANSQHTTKTVPAATSYSNAYQSIINEYAKAVTQGGSYMADHEAEFPNVNSLAISGVDSYGNTILYSLFDIDSNGVPELLLGYKSESNPPVAFDVYLFNGTSAVKLFDDDTLAERSYLTLYTDGTMYIYGPGGALHGNAEFYKILDGKSLKLEKEYTVDYEKYSRTPYYNFQESMSKADFEKMLAEKIPVTNFHWQPLSAKLNQNP